MHLFIKSGLVQGVAKTIFVKSAIFHPSHGDHLQVVCKKFKVVKNDCHWLHTFVSTNGCRGLSREEIIDNSLEKYSFSLETATCSIK